MKFKVVTIEKIDEQVSARSKILRKNDPNKNRYLEEYDPDALEFVLNEYLEDHWRFVSQAFGSFIFEKLSKKERSSELAE